MNIVSNLLSIWEIIDPIYFHFTRLEYIQNNQGKRTLMRVRLTKYKGRDLILSDGTIIKRNDLLIKIHLHNVKLLKKIQKYESELRRALFTFKNVQESLPYIADYLQKQHYSQQIKGSIGVTTLHKGSEKLGFEVFTLNSKCYKWYNQSALLPIYYLSVHDRNQGIPTPVYLVMSKDNLLKKYKI